MLVTITRERGGGTPSRRKLPRGNEEICVTKLTGGLAGEVQPSEAPGENEIKRGGVPGLNIQKS